MVSSDTGRVGIIKRAKEKKSVVAIRYTEVKDTVAAAMCAPTPATTLLASAYLSFQQKSRDPSLSAWSREDASKSLDVIDAYNLLKNQIAGYDFKPAPSSQPSLLLNGTAVFVTCDVLISRPVKGVDSTGAALFRLTKPDEDETDTAKAKREQMGRYVATLVLMQVGANLAGNLPPANELCWSLDIQAKEVHKAPKNTKTLISNLESACLAISSMWNSV